MRYLTFLFLIFTIVSCQKTQQMPNDFIVIPASDFLRAEEKKSFQFTAPGIQLTDAENVGTILSEHQYQAPTLIEQSQKINLTFKREKERAQVPIYLLDASAEFFSYQKDWISIDLGDKVLESNVWGVNEEGQEIKNLDITQFKLKEDQYLAWKWTATNEQAHTILAYPEIVFGWKPWRKVSTTTELPRSLNQIKSIPVKYEFEGSAKGSYNLAFDCWINQSKAISKENILTEVMIWQDWSGLNPIGKPKERVETPYGTYELWEGTTMDGWNCLTFRKIPPKVNGDLDLYWFLNYLVKKGLIEEIQILASVEFGNEIGKGSGVTILKNFQIAVE